MIEIKCEHISYWHHLAHNECVAAMIELTKATNYIYKCEIKNKSNEVKQ